MCSTEKRLLPHLSTFSGALSVPARGSPTSSALPFTNETSMSEAATNARARWVVEHIMRSCCTQASAAQMKMARKCVLMLFQCLAFHSAGLHSAVMQSNVRWWSNWPSVSTGPGEHGIGTVLCSTHCWPLGTDAFGGIQLPPLLHVRRQHSPAIHPFTHSPRPD